MNNHITSEEWRAYLSGGRFTSERLRLMSRVHAHLGHCEVCRAMHRKLTESSEALRSYAVYAQSEAEPAAYRAVASDAPSAEADDYGELTICVDVARGCFLYDTLTLCGDCEKYVFQPEADAPRLEDDCDPDVWMSIEDGRLRLSFPCPSGIQPTAHILIGDERLDLHFDAQSQSTIPLPAQNFLLRAGGARSR